MNSGGVAFAPIEPVDSAAWVAGSAIVVGAVIVAMTLLSIRAVRRGRRVGLAFDLVNRWGGASRIGAGGYAPVAGIIDLPPVIVGRIRAETINRRAQPEVRRVTRYGWQYPFPRR